VAECVSEMFVREGNVIVGLRGKGEEVAGDAAKRQFTGAV